MDRIFYLVIAAIAAVLVISIIKKFSPEAAFAASVCAGCVVLLSVAGDIRGILEHLQSLSDNAAIKSEWLKSIIKITCICFFGQWGVQLCRDAGENSIADKVETAVKIIVTVICLPYIDELLELVTKIE